MKKIIVSSLLLIITVASFGQQANNISKPYSTDYLKKSKNQKKIAWIMLGGGSALLLTGMIIPKGDVTHEGFLGPTDYENDGIRNAFAGAGILCELGSIPFFIASSKNKKKAMKLSFSPQRIPQLSTVSGFTLKSIPSINLKISL